MSYRNEPIGHNGNETIRDYSLYIANPFAVCFESIGARSAIMATNRLSPSSFQALIDRVNAAAAAPIGDDDAHDEDDSLISDDDQASLVPSDASDALGSAPDGGPAAGSSFQDLIDRVNAAAAAPIGDDDAQDEDDSLIGEDDQAAWVPSGASDASGSAPDGGPAAEHSQVEQREPFSCWSSRGNWNLHGIPWGVGERGRGGMPLIERVKYVLNTQAWSWDMDFSNAVTPSHTWFHISPSTLTERVAFVLVAKCRASLRHDFVALCRGSRLSHALHPRAPFAWVHVWVYYWNISRGWCGDPQCIHRDEPMTFDARNGLPRSAWDEAVPCVFSLQREHNEYFHQWWNIMGVIHTGCNTVTNSNPLTNARPAFPATDPRSTPGPVTFPPGAVMGGPSGHFADFHGGSKNPPFEVDQAISRESNYKRLRVWLENAGFEHTPICPCATNNSLQCHLHCVCPYGRKRAELITLVGGPDAFWGTTVRRPDRRRRP